MYALGVDLGTTFTAISTWRDGHAEIVSLGSRVAAIPSVVLLREDETFLTGEAANRRGLSEPQRVAREFKRRLGDTTPLLLGGVPYSADALMARLLRSVIDEVASREGGPASAICVCHPANWGPYKTDLLRQAVRMAGLDQPVSYTTEPEAAAVFYAQQQRVEPGAIVAVYDLGGGTFDAAVLRKTQTGFEILGQPEGIERLGGIDIDAAVFSHVSRALGSTLAELDEDDPLGIAAVARLRDECVQAKEALSADTDVSIPVLLPKVSTEIRLTRGELEAMVRPALQGSIEALKRAIQSAGVTAEQLHSVLLVGGSSRMPIVAQLVGAELGRPVAVDAHPKHAVALGAAWLASASLAALPAPAPPAGSPVSASPYPGTPVSAAPYLGTPVSAAPYPGAPVSAPPVGAPPQPPPIRPGRAAVPVAVGVPAAAYPPAVGQAPQAYSAGGGAPSAPDGVRRRKAMLVTAAAAVVALLIGGGIVLASADFTGRATSASQSPTADSGDKGSAAPNNAPASAASALPPDEQCTPEIQSNPRWVCLTKATFDGNKITIEYQANFAGASPNVSGGYHLHIYGGDGTTPADMSMGVQNSAPGLWYVEDQNPSVRLASSNDFKAIGATAKKVCARIATATHRLVPDSNGTYKTGNCVPITRPGAPTAAATPTRTG